MKSRQSVGMRFIGAYIVHPSSKKTCASQVKTKVLRFILNLIKYLQYLLTKNYEYIIYVFIC